MPDLSARVHELRALENLSAGKTMIHRLHPLAKIIIAFVFIIIVASFGRYDLVRLSPYLFYPFIMMALAGLPYKVLLLRVAVALPFCLFAGISNLIFERDTAIIIGNVYISYGFISFATILLKMYMCVMAALLLVATTPFSELTAQLRRMHVPMIFVMVFETTFRYISVLLEEVHSMIVAYKLRSGTKKSLDMKHMGTFTGQLVLRGFDRAERVHMAMRCRGYSLSNIQASPKRLIASDIIVILLVCLPVILLRFIKVF